MRGKILFIFIILPIVGLFSCEEYIGGDIATDSNAPANPPVQSLLTSVQLNIAYSYGGFFSRTNSVLVQHIEAIARGIRFDTNDSELYNDVWNTFYSSVLIEINTIQRLAEEQGFNHYLAVANILEAFSIMAMTDVFGSIPYSEAGLGIKNLNPSFDSQEEIYDAVHSLLDEAITLLKGPSGSVIPQQEDFIYNGDIDRWEKAAHALKARAYLHFADYEQAISEAIISFDDPNDNMSFSFTGEDYPAPWYNYNQSRTGDFEFHPVLDSRMISLNDNSRLSQLDLAFTSSHPYFSVDQKLDLISYREIQFILSEARLEQGNSATEIRDSYLNGINASFIDMGYDDNSDEFNSYIPQTQVDPGVGNIGLEHILTQKHIALFSSPESYTDWRRKGIPNLVPFVGTAIQVRWPYPQTTLVFNENAIHNVDIFSDRVAWDID